jgi:hypothetical protein
MRAQPLGAVLSVSVDLPAVAARGNRSADLEQETVARLVDVIAAARLSATWFSDDPITNETIGRTIAAGTGQEAALLVDRRANVAGGRNRWIAEVIARTSEARRAGIPITTLSVTDGIDEVPAELPADLLVKYGITAVRTAASDRRNCHSRSGVAGPALLRYGLWRVAVGLALIGSNPMADWWTQLGIRRAIDRCIRNKTPLHLAIDASAVAVNSGPTRLAGLPAILRHIAHRQRGAELRVLTIAQLVARLAAPVAPRAGGSILRAA